MLGPILCVWHKELQTCFAMCGEKAGGGGEVEGGEEEAGLAVRLIRVEGAVGVDDGRRWGGVGGELGEA